MQYVADLHLHSKYSRAVSQDMVLPTMAAWAKKKGIDILTTGDWTHPLWFREIRGQLEEAGEGLFKIKPDVILNSFQDLDRTDLPAGKAGMPKQVRHDNTKEPLFLLSVEVSSIYSQGGKLRRIHNLIFAPSFETAEKINKELLRRGVNLMSDGRPIMGLSSIALIELVLSIDKKALLIPCHAWTPWFSLYGSNSGFDSIDECFGDYARYIYAVETGLSSDPEMNWRIAELSNRSILSFSDAHSPAKMGREATVFVQNENGIQNDNSKLKITYDDIASAIKQDSNGNLKIGYTLEFYPEEGKYHYTGHRNCKVIQTPEETRKNGSQCPVCGRKLTVGVMHRVQELARGIQNSESRVQNDRFGVRWIQDQAGKRPPFVKLVPLLEIIAESLSSTVSSIKVRESFEKLVTHFGSEMTVLLKSETAEIEKLVGQKIAEGIRKVRAGDIAIAPGFDGEYGKVKIWSEENQNSKIKDQNEKAKKEQLGLF